MVERVVDFLGGLVMKRHPLAEEDARGGGSASLPAASVRSLQEHNEDFEERILLAQDRLRRMEERRGMGSEVVNPFEETLRRTCADQRRTIDELRANIEYMNRCLAMEFSNGAAASWAALGAKGGCEPGKRNDQEGGQQQQQRDRKEAEGAGDAGQGGAAAREEDEYNDATFEAEEEEEDGEQQDAPPPPPQMEEDSEEDKEVEEDLEKEKKKAEGREEEKKKKDVVVVPAASSEGEGDDDVYDDVDFDPETDDEEEEE